MPTPTSSPALTSSWSARSRWCGGAVPGSVVRQISGSSVGIEKVTLDRRAARRACEHVEVAERPAARA